MKKLRLKNWLRGNRIRSTKSASALLIAILVMGILMTLTLGLSDLVIREIRQTGDVVAAGKAYFSAEAGIENALLDLHENLPGYETKNPVDPSDKYLKLEDDRLGLHARYRILNKAVSVPFFDPDKPIFLSSNNIPTNVDFVYSDHAEATYNELPLSESATIPLYSVEDNIPQKVEKFLIEYYVDYKNDPDVNTSGIRQEQFANLDILRWKVFGKPENDLSKTDAISDFFPSTFDASENFPMCIGTDQTLAPTGTGQGCYLPTDDHDLWGAARECYVSDAGGNGDLGDIQKKCTIENFIQHHVQSYLVLTNVINPDVLMSNSVIDSPEAKKKFTIHYRVVAAPGEAKLVREAASISADGFASGGQVKQSIDVKIQQSSFLPVFNFSLYHTDTKL